MSKLLSKFSLNVDNLDKFNLALKEAATGSGSVVLEWWRVAGFLNCIDAAATAFKEPELIVDNIKS